MASIRKYGSSWRVQYRDPQGKSRTKSGFRTKTAAQAWADKNATEVRTGDWINPNAGAVTIGELGVRWLAMQTHLKPSTRELYEQVWSGAVAPHWGGVQVGRVAPSQVQAWVSCSPHKASWTRHAHNVLAQILDMAVADGMIRENPARGVKLPRREKSVKVFWTMAQLRLFAAECGDREDLILLLGTSGLRWGEAIALRPEDLDPLRGRIHVTRNAAKVGNKVVLGSPKTHERRTVAVAGHVMDMLVARAESVGRSELLWTGRRGGWLMSPGHRSWFAGALERAQTADPTLPRITPHGLRHVAAGLLVESGANVKAVQRQLGHASATMTLDTYAELFDDGLDVVADSLDAGFSNVVEMSYGDREISGLRR
ncbi:integrase [Corynebacterium phocae]|uniref:Integrase n=1 Tax=Corynebacterium phocae TaxID=161895 RepID=A0A1L7D456_9CORY|nr:site-specific integrase [Corynebacterium phocae]APT92929.1 integrase [Corynebacterium phocae]KAA8723261.1 site-specific integrase [Corynebacterium phocae]